MQPITLPDTTYSLDQVRRAFRRRYRVVRELGSGRTGAVYLAYDRRRERKLAVRVLSPSLAAAPEKREAFVRAAKAARFSHPNIARIRRVGHAAGICYVTMDYVDGETLAERVRREGPLTVGQATRMLYDVARGIACAHGNGVILGGLTPDDVIMERTTGRAVVTDLGIARALAVPQVEPAAYSAVVPFMSPEQVLGKAGDERSDIYALGVTAYFAVTGCVPFDGDTPEEIGVKHVLEPEPAFRLYNKLGHVTYTDVSVENTFADVLRKCLAKDPAARFRNAWELAGALEFAPEIARHQRLDLRIFPLMLHAWLESAAGSPTVALLALVGVVGGAATGEFRAVFFCGAVLAWMAADLTHSVLGTTRSLLAKRYTRTDMIRALRIETEREQELAALEDGGVAPGPFRFARRVIYGGVALAGVGAALMLVKLLPPEVGWAAIMIGGAAVLGVALSTVDEVRHSPYRAAQLWLTVWRSRAGDWIMKLAGWRFAQQPAPAAEAPEIAMLRAPSLEAVRREEATRDLVNLVPAMQHRVASRINAIRACLNAEAFATDPRAATPPLDWGMRARLELCLERLQLVRYRLGAVRIGDSRRRLVREYRAVERTCAGADALLEAVGAGG